MSARRAAVSRVSGWCCAKSAHYQPLTLLTAARRADISEAAVLAEQLLDAETGAS